MKELGEYSAEAHIEVGNAVSENCVDLLVTVGEQALNIAAAAANNGLENIIAFDEIDYKTIAESVMKNTKEGDVILFKASRAMAFERIIAELS
jgi:UDP-N-acetylmuramoyl-tripeptide--D-alanyl-D-alanine ligase